LTSTAPYNLDISWSTAAAVVVALRALKRQNADVRLGASYVI